MKKQFKLIALLIALLGITLVACNKKDSEPGLVDGSLDGLSQIQRTVQNIGSWDAGYVTSNGFFLYSEDIASLANSDMANLGSKAPSTRAGETSSKGLISYLSSDGRTKVSIIISKSDNMPLQVLIGDVTIDFCFLTDEVLEIVAERADGMTLATTINYNREELLQKLNEQGYPDNFMKVLYLIVTLTDGHLDQLGQIRDFIVSLKALLGLPVTDTLSVTLTRDNQSGLWRFVLEANDWTNTVITRVLYNISLWTGDAKFKLGGSSVTLGGAIYCASNTFNSLGTYGILVDKNRDNLTIDKADFKVEGRQENNELSFDVDFRGFEPKTTYYYRAYYQFNDADHGSLRFKYGDSDAQVGYDSTVKSFTTDDNILAIDVVMCMDVTGSMRDEIYMVKSNALTFYDQFKSRCDANNIILTSLTTQVVQFRDINVDGSDALLISPTYSLPEQKSDFSSYVNSIYADGGGDTPESGLEALQAAFSKSDWGTDDGYHRQIVILWTDAPYLEGGSYSSLTTAGMEEMWNNMPSGRRMILFAPTGISGEHSYEKSWSNLDPWTNVVHLTDITRGFNDMGSVLDDVIGELTGRGDMAPAKKAPVLVTKFQKN